MATEKRLVWTTDVMSFLCKRCNEMYPDEPCEPCDCLMTEELDKCKTVDAAPVVHGRWKHVDHDGSWRVDMCSICQRRMHYVDYDQPYQYCPNCGADMRGDGNA